MSRICWDVVKNNAAVAAAVVSETTVFSRIISSLNRCLPCELARPETRPARLRRAGEKCAILRKTGYKGN